MQEYTFRVRLREAREKVMDEQELKKTRSIGIEADRWFAGNCFGNMQADLIGQVGWC